MPLNLLFDGDGMIIFVKCGHAQNINEPLCVCVFVRIKMQTFAIVHVSLCLFLFVVLIISPRNACSFSHSWVMI